MTIGYSINSISSDAFKNCPKLASITLNSPTFASAVYTSSSNLNKIFGSMITEYIFGNDISHIGNYACYNNKSLTNIIIGNNVTSIGENAFAWCTNLTSVIIPNSVTSIGESAFQACGGLTSVTIPSSVTSIGENAFFDCYVTSVTCEATTPPVLGGSSVFNSTHVYPIYVPAQSVDTYKAAQYWSNYADRIYAISE